MIARPLILSSIITMLSPDDFSPKPTAAPSIWSFDSGYASEEKPQVEPQASSSGLGGLGLAQLTHTYANDQLQLTRDEPAIGSLVDRLTVFTTTDTTRHDLFLPELSSDGESCLKCEFWRITTEGENIKCEDCRAIPEIIEPHSLQVNEAKNLQTLPALIIPTKEVNMAATPMRCSACELSALVYPHRPTSCTSCSPILLSPTSPVLSAGGRVRRSRAGRNSKLPNAALTRLQQWLHAHSNDPYPSAEDKRQLAQECGITEKQVTTWFTNARARQLNPHEPGALSDSDDDNQSDEEGAVQTPIYPTGFTYIGEDQPRGRRAGSVSSSALSLAKVQQPSRRGKKKNYRNPKQPTISEVNSPTTPQTGDQEMWQCTFCRRHLVPKSWRRHEETQHRPRSQWTCMLFGPRISYPHRAGLFCAFCMARDPSEDHFLCNHRIHECAKRPIGDRTFFRPDHLRQHVKNFHNATLYDVVQARWKTAAEAGEAGGEGWTCGFCSEHLQTWDKRETHIANHFKEGLTMDQWTQREKPEKKVREPKKEPERQRSFRGLAGLTRTLTGRSRTSQSSSSTPFSNTFNPIPTTTAAPMHIDDGFSQPPMLPVPVFDPPMTGFGNLVDWTDFSTPQFDFPESPYTATNGQQTELDMTMMNNIMGYGNVMDHQPGPWSQS